jgi:hypothetical protein
MAPAARMALELFQRNPMHVPVTEVGIRVTVRHEFLLLWLDRPFNQEQSLDALKSALEFGRRRADDP